MKSTKSTLFALAAGLGLAGAAHAQIIFSQYIETDSGTTPKGIEVWNPGASAIDFSANNLVVEKGTNGGTPSSDFTLSTGTLAAGDVWVIGTTDMGTYLDNTFGAGIKNFSEKGFTFNGNDSLVLKLGGVTQDVFGDPGSDPGSAWTGSGVSTANQNIELIAGVTTGDTGGFTDPSTRFATVSTNPSESGGLSGFGVAPVPEPSAYALLAGLLGLTFVGLRRRRA
ncbi:MAG: PEP-CTERM sorting domain-containing protein [Opitutales bacterium]